jgi:hypothetical protein
MRVVRDSIDYMGVPEIRESPAGEMGALEAPSYLILTCAPSESVFAVRTRSEDVL